MGIFSNHDLTNDFWETAAQKSKLVNHDKDFLNENSTGSKENHFARIIESGKSPFQPMSYIEEVLESERENLSFPAVITESTRETIAKPSNSRYSVVSGAVIILQSTQDRDDFDSQNLAITESCTIADKFYSYLEHFLKESPLEGRLDNNRTAIYKIGPILDHHFGARLEYTIQLDNLGERFCYDAEDWN